MNGAGGMDRKEAIRVGKEEGENEAGEMTQRGNEGEGREGWGRQVR